MGLIYLFPTEHNESERIFVNGDRITLKTYGLPGIFWFYFLGIVITLIMLYLAISGPLNTILSSDDPINKSLALCVLILFLGIPFSMLCLFFYEKWIIRTPQGLKIIHKLFFLRIRTYVIPFPQVNESSQSPSYEFSIHHYLDSPNIAKRLNRPDLKGFENKGYFELYLHWNDERGLKKYFLDRHSRKSDLIKIRELLKNF